MMVTKNTAGSTDTVELGSVISINPDSVGKDFPFESINYIDISSVGSGTLNKMVRIKLSEAPGRARRLVQNADIILSTVRPNRRSFLFVKRPDPGTVVSTGFAVLRATDKIAPRFLYYTVTHQPFTDYLTNNARGAAYPAVDTNTIARAEIWFPPLPTQRKIAAVLSAYDGLIENNTRRIAILEEMAQALYREWFVHFRFPGHEQVGLVDSELGPIPEGWEIVQISDVVIILRRGIDPYKFGKEVFAHYSFPAFDTDSMPSLERGETIQSSKYIMDNNCVLLSKLNPRIPRVWLPFPDDNYRALASSEFLVLVAASPFTRSYLFSMCSSPEFLDRFASLTLGTSTSHQRVKPQDFLAMKIVLPPKTLIDAFSELVSPIFKITCTLRLKSANLRRTRDLLLPRLISGEVDVSELEINTGGLDQ